MMPPSRHSGSSRSAHKDSDQIPSDQNYTLGEYSFRVERSAGTSPNYDKIEAICTKDGKNARKSIQIPSSSQMGGWYVEANETEATVYAIVKTPIGDEEARSAIEAVQQYLPIPCGSQVVGRVFSPGDLVANLDGAQIMTSIGYDGAPDLGFIRAASYQYANKSYTYNNKTVYYGVGFIMNRTYDVSPRINASYPGDTVAGAIAWTMVYGDITSDFEEQEIMVGRFAIEIEDAGGVGPGSGWIDPGDYDPDWEEGEPTHTLYVTVTGALSGRHNDPIVDPSYSYIPADKDTVKGYGCGGDGGHGGGGGAGASTVVVHKFATNQANSKEVTAIPRRHGYGSGGGKGGKGGDGCILIYY